jgi:hypothetical protein
MAAVPAIAIAPVRRRAPSSGELRTRSTVAASLPNSSKSGGGATRSPGAIAPATVDVVDPPATPGAALLAVSSSSGAGSGSLEAVGDVASPAAGPAAVVGVG